MFTWCVCFIFLKNISLILCIFVYIFFYLGGRRFVSCNHQRSLDFMHHSINYRKVTPVGIECPEWKDFLDGKCSECGADTKRCAVMGIRAIEYYEFRNTSVQHAMYLKTSGKPPFWCKQANLFLNFIAINVVLLTLYILDSLSQVIFQNLCIFISDNMTSRCQKSPN